MSRNDRRSGFLFGAGVTAVYLNLSEGDDAGVPARRDGFVAAIAEVGVRLGPPPIRCPGPDPSVGWRVAAGVLEIVDRPGMLDLWLRPAPRRVPHPPAPPVDGEVDWAALEAGLAATAASLPAGVRLEVGPDARALVELRQTEDGLTVHTGGAAQTVRWPAAGTAYRKIAARLVTLLRGEAGSPADLAYRAARPVPHLPLRREMRQT